MTSEYTSVTCSVKSGSHKYAIVNDGVYEYQCTAVVNVRMIV